MSFPLISIPLQNAIAFSVYQFWMTFFIGKTHKKLSYWQKYIFYENLSACCGCIAGSTAAFLSCPIELTKCKL
jgi:solute carrier family 25 carnitine/acylcarnitine transporter 20/29